MYVGRKGCHALAGTKTLRLNLPGRYDQRSNGIGLWRNMCCPGVFAVSIHVEIGLSPGRMIPVTDEIGAT